MTEIIQKITDYTTLSIVDGGKAYDFEDKKTGRRVTGIGKRQIKLTTPFGGLVLKPVELLGLWELRDDEKIFAEVLRRSKE